MIITPKFIYLHMPKTGGHAVRNWLNANKLTPSLNKELGMDGLLHQSIHDIPLQYTNLPKFGFVRNPWDWYVSFYHFHKQLFDRRGFGQAFYVVASENNTLSFNDFIVNFYAILNDENLQKRVFDKMDERKRLHHRVSVTKKTLNTMVNNGSGICTVRFNEIFSMNRSNVNVINYSNNMSDDFIKFIGQYIPVTEDYVKLVTQSTSVNAVDHQSYDTYYNSTTKDLVQQYDGSLIDEFEFTFR